MSTIYVTDPGSIVLVKGHYLVVSYQQKQCCRYPVRWVGQIILFGLCHISPQAVKVIKTNGIRVLFISDRGLDLGSLEPQFSHYPKHRINQIDFSHSLELTQIFAESLIWAKLHNQNVILQQFNHYRHTPAAKKAINIIALLMKDLPHATSPDELLEYDATAASFYYPALASFLSSGFHFQRRSLHPPLDAINWMLNLGYTLLHQLVSVFAQTLELDTTLSNLHHYSCLDAPLADDLMAEFCPLLVDEFVVNLANNGIVTPLDVTEATEGIRLSGSALKTFLEHWEEKLQTPVYHFQAGTISYRQCLELQVQNYVACLVGDVEFYHPMLVKFNKPQGILLAPLTILHQEEQTLNSQLALSQK